MRKLTLTAVFLALTFGLFAQPLTRVGVLDIDAVDVDASPVALGNLMRLELQKLGEYEVVDRYDMLDMLQGTQIDPGKCYSKRCLMEAAKALEAQKMLSGSVELYGDKILITLKWLDVASNAIVKTDVSEYLDTQKEIQHMLKMSMNKLLDKEVDQNLANNLTYYSTLTINPTTKIVNNGPRMGVALITGQMAKRFQDPIEEGGYDMYPVISQFGYQHELQYLSSGNFQALVEMIFLLSGLEQSTFIPSAVVLNGFRESKYGFEFGFGPSFSVRQMARGFYDADGKWNLTYEWQGNPEENPYKIVKAMDSRGDYELFTRWIWSVGKTFRSGYLNIPVNLYISPQRDDWMYGLSVGFNLRKARRN
ncbi:MAG: hypothetical protein AAFR61_19870 [Bacteroidota bacterium]